MAILCKYAWIATITTNTATAAAARQAIEATEAITCCSNGIIKIARVQCDKQKCSISKSNLYHCLFIISHICTIFMRKNVIQIVAAVAASSLQTTE